MKTLGEAIPAAPPEGGNFNSNPKLGRLLPGPCREPDVPFERSLRLVFAWAEGVWVLRPLSIALAGW